MGKRNEDLPDGVTGAQTDRITVHRDVAGTRKDYRVPLPTAVSPSTPTRTLDSNFTPSAAKSVFCAYTISISCDLTLSGGESGSVELRSDSNTTPTTVRGRVSCENSGTLIVGIAITNAQEAQLTYLCPPGHNVRLVSSGTATIAITAQTEIALG